MEFKKAQEDIKQLGLIECPVIDDWNAGDPGYDENCDGCIAETKINESVFGCVINEAKHSNQRGTKLPGTD